MVVENNLGVIRGIDFTASYILVKFTFGVDIDDFTISFISKKKARLSAAGVNFEVWWVVRGTYSGFPIVVTQISGFGH